MLVDNDNDDDERTGFAKVLKKVEGTVKKDTVGDTPKNKVNSITTAAAET
jgi:hypothetical protein